MNTYPIEAAYVVLCHSDCEADLRTELPGFKHVSEYGQRQAVHENELGSWEQYRFICTPHMPVLSGRRWCCWRNRSGRYGQYRCLPDDCAVAEVMATLRCVASRR